MNLYKYNEKTLDFNKIKSMKLILIILIVAGLSSFTTFSLVGDSIVEKTVINHELIFSDNYDEVEHTFLYDEIQVKNKRAFVRSVQSLSERMNIPYNDLIGLMWFESRLNPKAKNPKSGAYGLGQWIGISLKQLKVTRSELVKMDAYEQLFLLEKYINDVDKPIRNFSELYLAIYLPAYLDNDDSYQIPQKYLDANPGYSRCKTVGQFKAFITKRFNKLKEKKN